MTTIPLPLEEVVKQLREYLTAERLTDPEYVTAYMGTETHVQILYDKPPSRLGLLPPAAEWKNITAGSLALTAQHGDLAIAVIATKEES